MRFPIVWITLALCVILCAIEVHSGPVDHQDLIGLDSKDNTEISDREKPYDEDSGEEDDDGNDDESGDDGEEGDDDDDAGDGNDEERRLKRQVNEASHEPLFVDEQFNEDGVTQQITDAPSTDIPTKKPSSVLLLLSNALDKAISATTKLPTQQMASDAASVFLLLGQVFSEAIDKVIGDSDDGPEEAATEIGIVDATEIPSVEENAQLIPIIAQPEKVDTQPQIIHSSQSNIKFI